jgi:hypothetical protein
MKGLLGSKTRLFSDMKDFDIGTDRNVKYKTDFNNASGGGSIGGYNFDTIFEKNDKLGDPFPEEHNEISTTIKFDGMRGNSLSDYVMNCTPFDLLFSLASNCLHREDDAVKSNKIFNLDTMNYLIKKMYDSHHITRPAFDVEYDKGEIDSFGFNGTKYVDGFKFGMLYDKPSAMRSCFNILGVVSNVMGNNEKSFVFDEDDVDKYKKKDKRSNERPKARSVIRKGMHEMNYIHDLKRFKAEDLQIHSNYDVYISFELDPSVGYVQAYMRTTKNYKIDVDDTDFQPTTRRVGKICVMNDVKYSKMTCSLMTSYGATVSDVKTKNNTIEKKIKIKINSF